MGKFGDKFRKERERQGIKIEDVSNSTKISARMLRAIEEEHFEQLPGGVFNKGFIRAYAKHLGLDEEESVATYLDTLNPPNGHAGSATAPSSATDRRTPHSGERWHGKDRRHDDRRHEQRRHSDPLVDELPDLQLPKAEHVHPRRRMAVHSDSSGVPWTVPVLIALIIVAGGLWWNHFRSANASNPAPANNIASVSTSPAATPAPADSNNNVAPATVPPASSDGHSAVKTTPTPAHAKKDAAQPETDASSALAAPKPHANLFLIIRASENSWISVTTDGQPVIQETLIAPAHASVSARREIMVRAGNAAGVTFALNGQEFPTQGAEGEVKTLIFDTSGMRSGASQAAPAPPTDPVP